MPTSTSTAVINLGSSGPIVNATGAVANTVEVGTTATGGTLGVQSGGVLTDASGWIGQNAGSTGTATVSGSGATWTNTAGIRVGNSGSGTLNIQSGGTVNTALGYLGYAVGSSGIATVTGSGSSIADSGMLYVGNNGNGTLNVQSGANVGNTIGYIGYGASSSGTATVTGSGSSWNNSGALQVGVTGNGTLNVEAGADVSDTNGNIASGVGGTGTATVTGAGSSWTNSGSVYVGNQGSGTLNIESGGEVSNTSTGFIGYTSGITGTATVTGPGSSWNNGALNVGYNGTGTLNIEDGGSVSSTTSHVANLAGSIGTATVTGSGSSWTASANLYVGSNGNGTLNVEAGGTVSDVSGQIANGATGNGTANIDGVGSNWENSEYVLVASTGIGTLNITNGAYVNSAGIVGTGFPGLDLIGGIVGNTSGASGTVAISGSGSAWNINGGFLVGGGNNDNVGEGSLAISDGGAVNDTSAYVGHNAGSTGSATVTGGGTAWNNSGDLYVGENGGTGTLTISNGASVTTGSGTAYDNNNATATSTSTVYIADTPGSTGTLNIGAPAGQAPAAPGTLVANTVAFGQGQGTLVFNHTSQNYLFAPVITGNGTIDALSGKTILTGGLYDFTGGIYVAPDAALTTAASLDVSTDTLGSDMRAMAIAQRSTPNALLGLLRPVDDGDYLFYGGMWGSSVIYAGGQHSADGLTVLGGIAQGTQDYSGIMASSAPTIAAALRYTFDDPFGDAGNALRPYEEIGGWVSPSTDLTLSRTYMNGNGLATGQGVTNSRSWGEYGRGGLVWKATKDDQFMGYAELGQQFVSFDGYTEETSPNNPFPATVGGGLLRMAVARFGGSWTRNLRGLIALPWSVTVGGNIARSFAVHSGLTATVDGLGSMTAANIADTWGEFGARLESRITEKAAFYIEVSGTAGGGGIGSAVHGGAGLSYHF
ncbi:MAG TPA: hypothetical protein VHU23_16510 [Rhizomicrobium sp.]|nr:hypothetical protein [Rhizomicrobium sp.]